MKKSILAVAICSLMVFGSCNKASNPGGSWNFMGGNYVAASCSGSYGILTASNLNNDNTYNYGTIECNFYQKFPAVGSTFTVVAYPPLAANQISMRASIDGGTVTYASTGGNGAETVNVTVNSNGYVTIKGSGIELLNTNGTDSSTLSIALTQTQ